MGGFFKPAMACAAAVVLAGMSGAASGQTEIKVGLSLPEGFAGFDHVNGMYETFKSEVERRTGGGLTVDLVYGGALGSPGDRLSQMRRGTIQMSDASEGAFASVYPDIQVLSIPYLFPDEQTAWKFFDGPFGETMAEDIRSQTGIRVLGWWEAGGFRHFSANAPIQEPGDMDGMKMRVMSPVFGIPVEAMGGSATPIPFNELYTSLKTGVVDGQDNAVNVFRLVKLYEVQDYLMLDGHVYSFGPLSINEAFFAGLPADQQQAVTEAAAVAIAYNREASRAGEDEALQFVREQGVTIVEFSDAQKQALADATQQAVIDWVKEEVSSAGLVDDVFAAVDAVKN